MSVPAPAANTQARRRIGLLPVHPKLGSAIIYIAVSALAVTLAAADSIPLKDQPHIRRPIADAWMSHNKLLAVANQRSGSISIVDLNKQQAIDEIKIGERLAQFTGHPTKPWWLAV